MAGQHAVDAQLLPRGLRIGIRLVVLACGGEGSDRQGRRAGERRDDFVGKGESQEVGALVGAEALKRKDGDRRLIVRDSRRRSGRTARKEPGNGAANEEERGEDEPEW